MASEPCAPVCYSEREAEGPWGARLPWPPTSCRLASLVPQRSPEDAGGQELGAPKPITSSGPGMPRRPRGFRECPRACGVGRGAAAQRGPRHPGAGCPPRPGRGQETAGPGAESPWLLPVTGLVKAQNLGPHQLPLVGYPLESGTHGRSGHRAGPYAAALALPPPCCAVAGSPAGVPGPHGVGDKPTSVGYS